MSDETDPLAEFGPHIGPQPAPPTPPRNKVLARRYIAYELPGDEHTYTVMPAASSRRLEESEDDWLDRTKRKYVPAEAVNVRIVGG